MKKEKQGLEEEWEVLRKKIRLDLDKGDLEEVEEEEQEVSSEQFEDFLSGKEAKAPVLEKVERRSEEFQELENFNLKEGNKLDSGFTSSKRQEESYIPQQGEAYTPSQNAGAPVLRPRDTMPIKDIPRHEFLNRTSSMSWGGVSSKVYPEVLESEEKKEQGKRYYKVTR